MTRGVNGVNEVSGLTASKLTTIVRRCTHQQSFVERSANSEQSDNFNNFERSDNFNKKIIVNR